MDLPSGLHPDTGQRFGDLAVCATHTLALLTLKPGLFTADGRDHAGDIWLDTLGVHRSNNACRSAQPGLRLSGRADLRAAYRRDDTPATRAATATVAVVGGAPGMLGAALLASRAALAAGAGKVFVATLDDDAIRARCAVDPN